MTYLALKHVHVGAVVISLALFVLRGCWMLAGSRLLDTRLSRIVPHIVDTILLASAIALSVVLGQYPFVQGWLTAKVLGLLGYIALGMIALRRGRTRAIRAAAFAGALVVFGWIVMTARAHAPYLPL